MMLNYSVATVRLRINFQVQFSKLKYRFILLGEHKILEARQHIIIARNERKGLKEKQEKERKSKSMY